MSYPARAERLGKYIYIYIYIYQTKKPYALWVWTEPVQNLTLTAPSNGTVEFTDTHLCRGVRFLPHKCPGYDIKPSDCKTKVLEIWGIQSTPSLPLLPGPFWPGVVVPDRVLSMGQNTINYMYEHITDVKLGTKNSLGSFKNIINKMCLQITYLIYMYLEDLALNSLQCLICHKTQTLSHFFSSTNVIKLG